MTLSVHFETPVALFLMVFSMICWGSWANTYKLAGRDSALADLSQVTPTALLQAAAALIAGTAAVAVCCCAAAYRYQAGQFKVTRRGVVVCIVSGLLIGSWAPLAAASISSNAETPAYVSRQTSPTAEAPRRAVLDVDPGIDDAIGLLLALRSPELHVEAVTVVAGNVTLERGTQNALRVLALARRTDIPVAKGASKPLRTTLLTATQFHGPNGMGGVELPKSTATLDPRHAADLIIELAHAHPRDLTLIATGPLTNVAMALRKDPAIAKQLSEIILMGGSTIGGNVTPAAEFNIHGDPEAARVVFDSGVPITMVGLNAAAQTLLTRKDVREMAASSSCIGKFVAQLGDFYLRAGESYGHPNGSPLYDPLAVAIAIDKTLASKTQPMRVDIETKGEFTYGETVVNSKLSRAVTAKEGDHLTFVRNEPVAANADVPTVIAGERFISLLVARLTVPHDGC